MQWMASAETLTLRITMVDFTKGIVQPLQCQSELLSALRNQSSIYVMLALKGQTTATTAQAGTVTLGKFRPKD